MPPESLIEVASIPVKFAPLPEKLVAVITPALPSWMLLPTLKCEVVMIPVALTPPTVILSPEPKTTLPVRP